MGALNPSEVITVSLPISDWADIAAAVQHAYGPGHQALEVIRRSVADPTASAP